MSDEIPTPNPDHDRTPKPFNEEYAPGNNPWFVYDVTNDLAVAAGTYEECEEFVVALVDYGTTAVFDIRRNN